MELFKPPQNLSSDVTILVENWCRWSQQFELFLETSEQASTADSQKAAILFHCAGVEVIEFYHTIVFDPVSDSKGLSDGIKWFSDYGNPRKNVVYERHNLWEIKQQDGQSFSHYLRDLRTLTRSCDLVQVDNMIGDKIVFRMSKMPLEVNELRGKVVRFTERGVWCVVLMTRWFPGLVPLHKKCLARLLLLLHQIPTLPMSSKVERL